MIAPLQVAKANPEPIKNNDKNLNTSFIFFCNTESGTRFLIASDGGIVKDSRDKGLQVFAPFSHQGAWIGVPLILQELGQVNLSAIIHPETPLNYWISSDDYYELWA